MSESKKSNTLLRATLLVAVSMILMLCLVLWIGGIEGLKSRQHLKGSFVNGSESADDESWTHKSNHTGVCLVSVIDVEIDDGNMRRYEEKEKAEEMLVCHQVSDHYDTGVSDHMLHINNINAKSVFPNRAALQNNEWFIKISHDWIETAGLHDIATIRIPDNVQILTIEPSRVPHHSSDSPHERRRLTKKLDERRRRLERTIGNRTVVVVAIDLTVSDNILQDHFFGPNDSLVTQMASCSQNQVTILPHPDHPIIKVSPPKHVSKYTFVDLYTTVLPDIKGELGLRNGQSITSVTDHIFLVVPDDIDRRPGELGWGATPGTFAGTIESLSTSRSTMTLLHELGHNFGLGHAYEDNVAYSDMSTVMGYSHRDVVKMCYNGFNMWQLGWFRDRTHNIQLSNNKNDKDVIELAFYGDYKKTTQFQPVIARYNDIYLTFNRRKDMNTQTKEYADMLLVVSELPGEFHSHSNLEKALGIGTSPFEMKFNNNQDIIYIEVCSYTAGNYYRPDVLTVVAGRSQKSACPEIKTVTTSSLEVPTVLPSDCGAVRPWVELKDISSPTGVKVEMCDVVAQNQDTYCDQMDEMAKTQVWNICRLQCHQSGCIDSSGRMISSSYGQPSSGGCENVFSSVRIHTVDSSGESQYVTRTCESLSVGFLSDRAFWCVQQDLLTRLTVSEVCKIECPNTGCDE